MCFACSLDSSKEIENENNSSALREATVNYNETHDYKAAYSESDLEVAVSGDYLFFVTKNKSGYEDFRVVQFKENTIGQIENLKSGRYEIADFMSELMISNGKNKFYFSLLKKPAHSDIFSKSETYSVVGISKNQSQEDLAISDSGEIDYEETVARLACRCIWWSAYDYCASGGEGSNFCSNGSCSVGCSEGYYACCK